MCIFGNRGMGEGTMPFLYKLKSILIFVAKTPLNSHTYVMYDYSRELLYKIYSLQLLRLSLFVPSNLE